MQPEEVIKAVLNNNPKEGWLVYRYRISWGILGLVFRLFYLALFGWMTWMFVLADPPETGFAIFIGILAVICIFIFLNHIVSLLYAKTNMIVLTEKSLIKSWRGNLYQYKYSQIKELKITRVFGGLNSGLFWPKQYVGFVDEESGQHLELARNRTFGLASNIYASLQSKLNI